MKVPKPIQCFIDRCPNLECKANDGNGKCRWGDRLRVAECSEYEERKT